LSVPQHQINRIDFFEEKQILDMMEEVFRHPELVERHLELIERHPEVILSLPKD